MKRTPAWVFVAAVGIQLAALCLCAWAMERVLGFEGEPPAPPAPPQPPPRHEAPPAPLIVEVHAAPPPPASEPAPKPAAQAEPHAQPEPYAATERGPSFPPRDPNGTPRHVTIRAVSAPVPPPQIVYTEPLRPLLGAPPARPAAPPADPEAIPSFITDPADATTQIVRGAANGGSLAFGFYPDGNIRLVDIDGGRYTGKAESARARMREIDGMRAFTVQIGVAADGRLQATFTGGTHDAETIALEPLVGWSAV
jgi:hypothetical protein